ncbi:hypothetical protein ACVWYG_000423 [Pedobacter sp. UYEF25]
MFKWLLRFAFLHFDASARIFYTAARRELLDIITVSGTHKLVFNKTQLHSAFVKKVQVFVKPSTVRFEIPKFDFEKLKIFDKTAVIMK